MHVLTLALQHEHDVVLARQRARQVAVLLAFDLQDQTRLATAVSEIARNTVNYAGGGTVEFAIEGDSTPQVLLVRISDILELAKIEAGRVEFRAETFDISTLVDEVVTTNARSLAEKNSTCA